MKFLSNTHNPKAPNARMYFKLSYEGFLDKQVADREWKHHLAWVNNNIVGRPQATDFYTTEQLEAMNMVGIYEEK